MRDNLARALQIVRTEQAEEALKFRGARYDKNGIWRDKNLMYRSYNVDNKGNINIIDD